MIAGAKWAIGCGIAVVLAVIAVFMLVIASFVAAVGSAGRLGAAPRGDVALVRVEGPITGTGAGLFSGVASSARIAAQLQQAAERGDIRAVLVRIDSPGGSAAASQEIHDEIQRVRSKGKPVYVSMGDVAASGGYYVACAAERIYANPGTITGSIGVISATLDLSKLLGKIGVGPEVVKTGEFKDMGSGLRPMTDRERQLTKQLLDSIYGQFVTAVAEGRHLTKERVRALADGRVYTGEQAVKIKLVDELGGMRPALRAVARRAGITGEPRVAELGKQGLLDLLFSDMGSTRLPPMKGILYDRMADLLTRGALATEQ
jgi:protease-4